MHLSFKSAFKRYTKIIFHSFLDIFTHKIHTNSMPVFVVGCGNSGTTLTATILSRHPDAFPIGFESSFFFPTHGLNYSAKTAIMLDLLTRQHGKSFFLEKTPKHALCINRIFKILPQAKILYVLRDGRDVAASLKKRYGSINIATERWINDNLPLLSWQHDPRVCTVRYEDLVSDPEQTILKTCHFLGITYNKNMLDASDTPYNNTATGNMAKRVEQVTKPIYNNTGKWKTDLTETELLFFMHNASTLMKNFNYI